MQVFKRWVVLLIVVAASSFYLFGSHSSQIIHAKISPGPPLGFTNAPGEGNCTGCHYTFALNSGAGKVEISGIPASYALGES